MTPPLHRDDMRFHITVGTTQVLVSESPVFLNFFSKFESIDYVFIIVWLVRLDICHG